MKPWWTVFDGAGLHSKVMATAHFAVQAQRGLSRDTEAFELGDTMPGEEQEERQKRSKLGRKRRIGREEEVTPAWRRKEENRPLSGG